MPLEKAYVNSHSYSWHNYWTVNEQIVKLLNRDDSQYIDINNKQIKYSVHSKIKDQTRNPKMANIFKFFELLITRWVSTDFEENNVCH